MPGTPVRFRRGERYRTPVGGRSPESLHIQPQFLLLLSCSREPGSQEAKAAVDGLPVLEQAYTTPVTRVECNGVSREMQGGRRGTPSTRYVHSRSLNTARRLGGLIWYQFDRSAKNFSSFPSFLFSRNGCFHLVRSHPPWIAQD